MRTLEQIRQDDAACLTYSDGSIHCSEPGDNVAADRRRLLRLLKEAITLLDEARYQLDDLHGPIDDQIAAFKAQLLEVSHQKPDSGRSQLAETNDRLLGTAKSDSGVR